MNCQMSVFALLAAGASMCSAQSIYMTNTPNADGSATIDVVLDATDYSGAFVAWHQFNFNLEITGRDAAAGAALISGLADDPGAAAASDNTGDGNANFGPFGDAWTGGRRPGAFPGAGALAGGVQFGDYDAVVTDNMITGVGGSIGGRQGSLDAEGNVNLHRGRVFEVFRFRVGPVPPGLLFSITPTDVILNLYTTPGSGLNEFVAPSNVSGIAFIPSPGAVGSLVLAGALASRRRRSCDG